ncbi:MAG: asparagine synthase (glutamine-hydrolyzing) [Gemmatimonadota bacterium]
MCGIVAILALDAPLDEPSLRAATAALRHRGPDGMRTWISDDGRVGLGHTRLAIVDPGAMQPIANENGRTRIVANGEFYGFEEIRRELEGRGHRFRTRSDSEIALHLWESEGARCLERLRGEFALVIWDEHRQTLFAARDRFGIKPLVYARANGLLYLASEAKALFAAGLAPEWDEAALFHTLHACPLEDRTMFAGVYQVPPGHFLTVTEGVIRLERYWDVGAPSRRGSRWTAGVAESVERIGELVEESVRLRLRADVPVGCLLSGGLDSSSILGLAAAYSREPVAAFTIAFDQREYDESAAAAEMARHAGAQHTLVMVSEAELADHFGRATWQGEMVQYNAHGTARYLLSRAIQRAGYKTVLGGEGADEIFLGYRFLRAALPQTGLAGGAGRWLKLALRLLRAPRKAYPQIALTSPWLARVATALAAAPDMFGRLDAGIGLLRSVLARDFLETQGRTDIYRAIYRRSDARAGISRWDPVRQLRYLWFHSIFPNYHLAADRLDLAHGVEVRLPFLDHVLFEHVNALPVSVVASGPQEKFLLREAMRSFLPEAAYRRGKKPFWAPPSASRSGSRLNELVQDTLRSERSASVPFFDRDGVARMLDGARALDPVARAPLDPLLMMMASVCMLDEAMADRYRIRTPTIACR